MITMTTKERVQSVRMRYDRLVASPPVMDVYLTQLRELLNENHKIPHSSEQVKMENDLLEMFKVLNAVDKANTKVPQ
jgi:hypothetical protein